MPPIIRIRSALACRVVGLDRQKFNEAVADGFYTCAPMAMQGSTRIFTEEKLLPLYFFARLLELGLPPRIAGSLACEAYSVSQSRGCEASDRIILLRSESMGTFVAGTVKVPATGELQHYDPDHEKNGTHYPGLGHVVLTVEFYFSHVRKIIAERIEVERNTFGEEDPE